MTFSQQTACANDGAFSDRLLGPRYARSLEEILRKMVRDEILSKARWRDAGFEKTG